MFKISFIMINPFRNLDFCINKINKSAVSVLKEMNCYKSTSSHFKLLILGGGTGGCAIASKFSPSLKDQVAIIEPNKLHYYQSMFTLVGGGLRYFDETFRPSGEIINRNCKWFQDSAVAFDPDNNTVTIQNGDKIIYDYLLVALGLQLNYHLVKGLPEALETDDMVCSTYSPIYVNKVLPAVKSLKDGLAIFTYPDTPIKCAGAAQKILYLSEERIAKAGLRDKVDFCYKTALPAIFPVPHYAKALDKFAESRNIKVDRNRLLVEVNCHNKEATFKFLDEKDKFEVVKYSLLHVAPPMSTPSVLWNSPLVDATNFVSVNPSTLQHSKYSNVFALGDCTNAPTSKTAAACASQIGVVSKNLKSAMNGEEMTEKYEGYTSCPLTVSSSKVILAEFGYDQKIMETFPFDQRVPRYSMFFLKAYAMPIIYWKLMVRGWWHGPSFFRKIWRTSL